VATTHTRLMTFAEFEQLPDSRAARHELRHGELFAVSPPKHDHYLVQRRLRRLLESAAVAAGTADAGEVEIEMSFRALPEHEYRTCDVAFVSAERWRQIPVKGNLPGAPDLVIEVLSPSNTVAEMFDKRMLCLENGSREFWVVDMDHRQVEVSTPDGVTVTYKSSQQIPLFFAAGQKIAVDTIFS
jgi:Uma2 family endonuclease